jgi:rhodanese-related sulfurtransferase
MHHGNQLVATARINPTNASHEILRNVAPMFETGGSLYKTAPLAEGTTLLLIGSVEGHDSEPLAWTHEYGGGASVPASRGGRLFYTSLGHPKDFENASFRNLLVNAVFWCLAGNHPSLAIPVVKADDVKKLLEAKKAVVLDVRRPDEYATGHIPGAINLSVEDAEFDAKAGKLDTNKTYIVHCVHGLRSAKAAQKLKCLNFESVDDFSGGIRAWEEAGKPVVK